MIEVKVGLKTTSRRVAQWTPFMNDKIRAQLPMLPRRNTRKNLPARAEGPARCLPTAFRLEFRISRVENRRQRRAPNHDRIVLRCAGCDAPA
ncbi:MAG: hypothetical protein HPM95_18280 [Alphaproteobacteria bacterium]|nr:hypothetical protein [Alphaproteobacteria bacterium]